MPVAFVILPTIEEQKSAEEELLHIERQLKAAYAEPDRFKAEIPHLETRHAAAKATYEQAAPQPDPVVATLEQAKHRIESSIAIKEVQAVLETAGETDEEKLDAINRELERRKAEDPFAAIEHIKADGGQDE
jgi:hypothetical protein